jgi:hypothetical protein
MDKRPEAMTDQDRLIEVQMNIKDKTRLLDILTSLFLLIIMFGFTALILFTPDKDFSEQENRYLQQAPKLTPERLTSGKFTSEISDYFSDQFPARDIFVGAKAITEIGLLKRENNSVTLGKEDYLIKRNDYPNFETIDKNVKSISRFGGAMEELGIPFTVAMAGRNVDVLQRYLPKYYPNQHSVDLWDHFETSMSADLYTGYVDLKTPLKAIIDSGTDEQIYYRTDHHWTTLGAYYAYAEIMKSFGEEPLELSYFEIQRVSDEFFGTTWSSAGMKWVKPDVMKYFRYDGDEYYITEIVDTGRIIEGFYDFEQLDKKDKYSSFIGGNNSRVDIYHSEGTVREKVLMMKDSFAHSLAPFLAYHYDLVILDLRYYKNSVKELVIAENIDRVLIMNNIDNISDTNVYGILQLGLN